MDTLVNWKRHGRKKPYTNQGVARLPCFRCGGKSFHQWKVCSDGLWRPLCAKCDLALNLLVLAWMRFGRRATAIKTAAYKRLWRLT